MIEVKLPSLGADMDKGTLLEWRVRTGDSVKKGDIIAVVDTSKAAIDVESWHSGTVIELAAAPGDVIPVGSIMAYLAEAGESLDVAREKISLSKQSVPPERIALATPATIELKLPPVAAASLRVSPAARRRAAELEVDLSAVSGSGPGGAITLEDVERTAHAEKAAAPPATPSDRYREMRKSIAQAMTRSKHEIPHYYLYEEVALERTFDWLRRQNETRPVTQRLLIAALYIKALALAAAKYPEINGFFVDGEHRPSPQVHVGVAISLRQGGLIAPAIHDAERRSLDEIMNDLTDLVRRTRTGSLRSSELSDPTITLTNLGEQSVSALFPVINPPQVAIIGVGKIADRPWVRDTQICISPVATFSLAADHRVSDGHRGAMFLAEIRELLQAPENL